MFEFKSPAHLRWDLSDLSAKPAWHSVRASALLSSAAPDWLASDCFGAFPRLALLIDNLWMWIELTFDDKGITPVILAFEHMSDRSRPFHALRSGTFSLSRPTNPLAQEVAKGLVAVVQLAAPPRNSS